MRSDEVILSAGMVLEVDCSKPLEDPDRETLRPMTAEEARLAADDRDRGEQEQKQRAWVELRANRDALLAATDHMEDDWAEWRQELRDLPATVENPAAADWPTPPSVKSTLFPWRSFWPDLDWSPITKGS